MTDIEKLKELEARLRTYALAEDIFGQERRDLEAAADLLASLASKDEEIEILHDAEARWIARLSVLRMHSGDNGKMMLAEFSTWFEKRWNELLAAETSLASKDAEIERLKAERGKALAAVAFIADEGTYSDSYGVPGSDFGVCRFCEAGGGPGVPFEHSKNCPILRCEQVAEQWWEDRQIDIEDAAELRADSAESRLTTALAALGEAKSGLVEIEAITPHKATRLCARAALAKLNALEGNEDGTC